METKNFGLISHDELSYQDESSYEEESVEDDDAITSGGFVEALDKTDQEIHELKNDDSESIQCDDDSEEDEEGLKIFFLQLKSGSTSFSL